MAAAENTAPGTDDTHDLVTGRHRDDTGRERDLVAEATVGTDAEATVGTDAGALTDPADEVVTDATVGPGGSTGVVTDRDPR